MLRRDLKVTLIVVTDVVIAEGEIVSVVVEAAVVVMARVSVAITMAVAEGEIVSVVVRAAVVNTVADGVVDVADSVVEGIGPAVKTVF